MAKVAKEAWGGIIKYDDDEVPLDIRSFNVFGKSAVLWLEQSRALHWAADSLKKSERSLKGGGRGASEHVVALMLGGYAVETLLKMVIVSDYCEANGITLDSRRAEEFLPKTHDLQRLAAEAKLRINATDRATLASLAKYIQWAGRYPIPLFAAGYSHPAIFDGIGEQRAGEQQSQWTQYDALYRKLHRLAVRKTFRGQITRHVRAR